ncbi:hypothetical protein EJ02DRAFT_461679 [Clathrospora elynae]|uniref:Uncharacterized protein n=1 Tax=Clathrospora elynae TaxID=706981 RepID=A0A6A5T6M5_9PLEO|nr:hypothetical protein EJ02DRAFT_461679 [Clathrospora elynae]
MGGVVGIVEKGAHIPPAYATVPSTSGTLADLDMTGERTTVSILQRLPDGPGVNHGARMRPHDIVYGPVVNLRGGQYIAQRAVRAIDGVEPLPACVKPHPTTGEYTTVETRYRAYWEQELRTAGPDDAALLGLIDGLWNARTALARDVERLEHLCLRLGPFSGRQPPGGLRQGDTADESSPTKMYVEYGALLEKLMPREVHLNLNTSEVIDSIGEDLQHEARMFSLLSPIEEEQRARSAEESWSGMTEVHTTERRRTLAEDLLRRHRLSRFVDSGVYRHYVSAVNYSVRQPASPLSAQDSFAHRARIPVRALETPSRIPTRMNSWSIVSNRYGPNLDAPITPSRWQPGLSPFRSPDAEVSSMRLSWYDGSPRGANAESMLDPEAVLQSTSEAGSDIVTSLVFGLRNRIPPSPTANPHQSVIGSGCSSVRPASIFDLDALMHTLQVHEPSLEQPLGPEEMHERRATHEAFLEELQRLNLGPQAQADATRLFPRSHRPVRIPASPPPTGPASYCSAGSFSIDADERAKGL